MKLLGDCSSQSPPLLTSTSVGTLCIEQESHELISTWHHLFSTSMCLVLCEVWAYIELNNKHLAFEELHPIKRDRQTTQVRWWDHSRGRQQAP